MEEFTTDSWPQHPGVSAIAREAGIELRPLAGSAVPPVLSIDQLITMTLQEGEVVRLVGVSCKPLSKLTTALPSDRIRERLELDRRYCAAGGFKHLLIHPEQISKTLRTQLDWLAPLKSRAELFAVTASVSYQTFVERMRESAYSRPLYVAAKEASHDLSWSDRDIRFCTHTALWRLDLDADLLRPLCMLEPLQPGGLAARDALRKNIFGEMTW